MQDVGKLTKDVGDDRCDLDGGEIDQEILDVVEVVLDGVYLEGEVLFEELVQYLVDRLQLFLYLGGMLGVLLSFHLRIISI